MVRALRCAPSGAAVFAILTILGLASAPAAAARLEVTLSPGASDAVLFCSQADFDAIDQDSTLRAHFSRVYNKLSLTLDKNRTPALSYDVA